jgi:hypothetical protein
MVVLLERPTGLLPISLIAGRGSVVYLDVADEWHEGAMHETRDGNAGGHVLGSSGLQASA